MKIKWTVEADRNVHGYRKLSYSFDNLDDLNSMITRLGMFGYKSLHISTAREGKLDGAINGLNEKT